MDIYLVKRKGSHNDDLSASVHTMVITDLTQVYMLGDLH